MCLKMSYSSLLLLVQLLFYYYLLLLHNKLNRVGLYNNIIIFSLFIWNCFTSNIETFKVHLQTTFIPSPSSHFRFRFAYLNLTSLHLYWCRQVARASLMEALSEPERTSISYLLGANKDLLEGMVLAINSTGRYYHLFLNAGNLPGKDQNEEGDTVSFLGLDDDEELADDIRFDWASRGVERGRPVILDGFDAWLDRLYEGTLPKIHVSTWPVQLT